MMQLSDEVFDNCENFTCGNPDLDDFFMHDSSKYADELNLHLQTIVSRPRIWNLQQKIGLTVKLKIQNAGAVIRQH